MPIDLPSDFAAFKAQVIADQQSDDQGVYEVLWAANSRYADLPASSRLAIAEHVLRELLDEGRVTLVQARWQGGPRGDGVTVAVADVDATLKAWGTWVPDPVVWMVDPPQPKH